MKKLIIIPAYNEAGSIQKTVEQIKKDAKGFDFVVINDCSKDRTGEICEAEHIPVIHLPVNLGIGGAVQTGYQYALWHGYDVAVQVDGDGQHDPKYLEKMAEVLEAEGADLVIGSRFLEKEGYLSSGVRRVGIRFFSLLIRFLTGQEITDPTSGMRMVGREVLESFAKEYPTDYPEPETVVKILKSGKKVVEVPVRMRERNAGVSSISLSRSIYYMIKVSLAMVIASFQSTGER
ncbi:MAG: glycosyltransferase family 2 protein [Eubacteriales bacterium]|nr:glycosyltransferase family 2 protein [Eubacteriales bacterium]